MIGRLALIFRLSLGSRIALAAAVLLVVAALHAFSQPPKKNNDDLDQLLIPPEKPKDDPTRYRIDKDRLIFTGLLDPKSGTMKGGIEDNRPLTSSEELAVREVLLHAAKFTAAELAGAGRRDLTPDDLTFSARFQFRLELLRFEGKLTKARRLAPFRSLDGSDVKELFEVRLVPAGDSPGNPLILLLTQWPKGLGPLPAVAEGQLAGPSAELEKWVAIGGYFFKVMTYPGPDADPTRPLSPGWLKAPLLIGRSLIPVPEPAPTINLEKNLRIFREIRDDTFFPPTPDQWEQYAAWNRIFLHVRRFSTEQLEAAANRKVPFAELFEHHPDYRLDLIYFQGQLVRLVKGKTEKALADAGIHSWYQAWIIPNGEPSGNPICVAILDLPEGLEPQKSMDVPVSFAGYSFKRLRYESGEKDKDDKNIQKLAPFLIGRSLTVRRPEEDATKFWTEGFVPAVVGGVVLLGGLALTLGWWFRKGDRAARAEIEANRSKNPF